MKVNPHKSRQVTKYGAWYYLPIGREKTIEIHKDTRLLGTDRAYKHIVIRIPARKLLRELLALGIK